MLILKVGNRELKVKYEFEATLKTRLLSRMAKIESEKEKESGMESIENLFLFLPEVLLIGLQKFHLDEYGFNYETKEGKDENIKKMYDIIEEFLDNNEEEDAITLYNKLTEEMLENGFLKSQFQKELKKVETKQTKEKTEN